METRAEKIYREVNAYLKANPDETISSSCKKLGFANSMYYGGKSKVETGLVKPVRVSRAIKPKRKYTPRGTAKATPPAPAFIDIEASPAESAKAVVIVCSPADLRNIVANVLG